MSILDIFDQNITFSTLWENTFLGIFWPTPFQLLKLYQTSLIIQWVLVNQSLLYTTSPIVSEDSKAWTAMGGMNKYKTQKSRKYKSRKLVKKYKSRKIIKSNK
jgi:hypothetical protein